MLHQSDSSNVNNAFMRIKIHAKALQKLFMDIKNDQGLSYLSQKYSITDNVTISNMLKSLNKFANNVINTKGSYEKQLQKIEDKKTDELKKLLKHIQSSKGTLSESREQINKIVDKKEPEEDILKAQIQMENTKLNDIKIDIQVCNYLQDPQKGFNALAIVQQYETTYMKNIYSDDIESFWVISSGFTHPSSNQEICKAINILNKYMLNLESKLNSIDNNSISDHSSSSYEATSSTVSPVPELEPYFIQRASINSTFTDGARSSLLGIDNDENHTSEFG